MHLKKSRYLIMKDLYKILNLTYGASESKIKTKFRKLVIIYHPDKTGGSKIFEEIFKEILNAYFTLTNKEKRAIYDLKYKHIWVPQEFQISNQKTHIYRQVQPTQNSLKYRVFHKTEYSNLKVWFTFCVVVILYSLLYLNNIIPTTKTTTKKRSANSQVDLPLEKLKTEKRPESGEIQFTD